MGSLAAIPCFRVAVLCGPPLWPLLHRYFRLFKHSHKRKLTNLRHLNAQAFAGLFVAYARNLIEFDNSDGRSPPRVHNRTNGNTVGTKRSLLPTATLCQACAQGIKTSILWKRPVNCASTVKRCAKHAFGDRFAVRHGVT